MMRNTILLCLICTIFSINGFSQAVVKDPVFKNAHVGIIVYNPVSGKYIADYQGDKYFTPASNNKLLTCYAAMKHLGDSIPGVQYQIINDSTILIGGTGDPTFLHPDFESQPVYDFLKQFKNIEYQKSRFKPSMGSGWAWDDYQEDYSAPRSSMPLYGNVAKVVSDGYSLKITPGFLSHNIIYNNNMVDQSGIDRDFDDNKFNFVRGGKFTKTIPFVPNDYTVINLLSDTLHNVVVLSDRTLIGDHILNSRPLDTMLSIMMHRSDNFYAEQSLLMVSRKLLGKMDDEAITDHLLATDYTGMPQKPNWVDGSGLSRYDLVTPKDLVFVLQKMMNEFGLERMKKILPTGGTGTLEGLYTDMQGSIFAKTGTLNGVIALSGYLVTKKNHLLIFSFLVNNHTSKSRDVRKGIEKYIHSIWEKY